MDYTTLSIRELQAGYKSGAFTVTDVVQSYLERIKKQDKDLNSYITVWPEEALLQAKRLDKKIKTKTIEGKLFGVPVAVKDVISTKDFTTTAGSQMLKNYKPVYSATVYEKILAEQGVVLGKTNCDEFAMGASGENSSFGPTKNPWDSSRVSGGSSSGSAAAVAARLCRVALGTDTGGSVRQPAGFCGVVGVKPTYGRASRHGIIAMASSFDQVGVIAPTVEECALVTEVISGLDPLDSTSSSEPVPNYTSLLSQPAKFKIGILKESMGADVNPSIKQHIINVADKLTTAGHKVTEVSLPDVQYALPVYYIITPAEVSANLARYDGLRFGESENDQDLINQYTKTRGQYLGEEVKRRIILGTFVLSAGYYDAYYRRALAARQALKNGFAKLFKKVDFIIGPTSPTIAFAIGEKNDDPLAMYKADINTVPASVAGLPAMSVPLALVDGLPMGLQIIAPWFKETELFQIGQSVENLRGEWKLP